MVLLLCLGERSVTNPMATTCHQASRSAPVHVDDGGGGGFFL
jgi:hypothetical protein